MVNVELIINGKLCDITNPYDLGIRLQKEILIPSEITTKDVQYSYTITLPFSKRNDEIFGYANNEEVKNKFNHLYNAELIVDSIKIFEGLFKLSSIVGNYKGNLYKPSKLTIKEIFGDKNMNQNGSWEIPFSDFSSFDDYNSPSTTVQPCIFPLVLYGLLPKVSKNPNAVINGEMVGEYTAKDLWDEYVRLGIEDFPPSVNVLQMLRKIFENNGYTLGGTAFDDTRLSNLYVSYKNPSDYEQQWNWGNLSRIRIRGTWENVVNRYSGCRLFERNIERNETEGGTFYTCDLLNCNRVEFISILDTGTNTIYSEMEDKWGSDPNYKKKRLTITIPQSGFYKIHLNAYIEMDNTISTSGMDSGWRWTDDATGNRFTSAKQFKGDRNNRFERKRYEVQLVRDYGEGSFETANKTICGWYFKPNNPQNNDFSSGSTDNYPKYFPYEYKAQLVDASADDKFLCGLHWGKNDKDYNPKGYPANYMFIKNGYSWDNQFSQKDKIYSAYHNPDGSWCWGTDDDATIEIDPNTGEEIEGGDDNVVLAWKPSNRYAATINNIPESYIFQHQDYVGRGELYHIVWLNKGEHLTLLAVSDANDLRRHTDHTKWNWGMGYQNIDFLLEIEPFRTDRSWVKINNQSNGYSPMNWEDEVNFRKNGLDLISFLPSDVKTDEWIENFCKAFNLTLTSDEKGRYSLNVKQANKLNTTSVINLEDKTNVRFRVNEPLGLPSSFELGFKINNEEEGYVRTGIDGGGKFDTGTLDSKVLSQTSSFSYNWFKPIRKNIDGEGEKTVNLPIISNNEVWTDEMPYSEGLSKWYTSYSQRFFYYNGTLNEKVGDIILGGNKYITVADVSNTYDKDKILILDYENKQNSILTTYFTVISNNDSNYTEIECYLTADEYEKLNGNSMVKFNGDLYYISSLSGYDPTMANPTKLKLIRKVNI